MTQRKKPTRAEQKARTAERHEIVRSIMQEPDDIVHFPVAFGRIAMNAATWGAVALGVLALGVLASAVILMREELGGLAMQIQKKDTDLSILSGELQKVRDQMFGEQVEMAQQGMRIVAVSTETGALSQLPASIVERDAHPFLAVAGPYVYQAKDSRIVRRVLKTGAEVDVLRSQAPIVDLIVSNNGEWLAYSVTAPPTGDAQEAVRTFVTPLAARGDAIELGPWQGGPLSGVDLVALSDDGKTIVWRDNSGDSLCTAENLHRVNVANGKETGVVNTTQCFQEGPEPAPAMAVVGPTPDGNSVVLLDRAQPRRLLARSFTTGRDRVLHTFAAGEVLGSAALSLDGTEAAVIVGDAVFAVPVAGGTWREIGKISFDAGVESDQIIIAFDPEHFLLLLFPDLAGRYSFRNLTTGTIAFEDGPLVNVIGWSSDLNTVVLLEDTRE